MDTLVLGRKRRSNARSGHLLQSAWGTGGDILELGGSSDGKESACNAGDPGLIPGLGRSPGEGMAIHSSILVWKIPWMEEPDRLQSMWSGSQTRLSNFTLLHGKEGSSKSQK